MLCKQVQFVATEDFAERLMFVKSSKSSYFPHNWKFQLPKLNRRSLTIISIALVGSKSGTALN